MKLTLGMKIAKIFGMKEEVVVNRVENLGGNSALGTGGGEVSFVRKLVESVGLGRDIKGNNLGLGNFRAAFKHVGEVVNGKLQFKRVKV